MRPIVITVGPLASASATGIAVNQTVTGAANMVLTASPVTLDTPRHVLITNAGNDSGITFTITGTTYGGAVISETVTGTSGSSVSTVSDFATVTSIKTSGSTSVSGASAGTNSVAGSSWVRFDDWAPGLASLQATISGTVNYTVQTTNDDPNSPTNAVSIPSVTWVNSLDTNVVSASATKSSYFAYTPIYARVLLNSGTGSVTATFLQSSNGPI